MYWPYKDTIPDNSDAEWMNDGRSPVSYLLQAWLLFDYLTMPAQQILTMRCMCQMTRRRLKRHQLVDEQDLILAGPSGKEQLTSFVLEAMAILLVTGQKNWRDVTILRGDVFYAQGCGRHLLAVAEAELEPWVC